MVDASWDRLRRSYEKFGLVLVLGAGVSKDSGLPMWSELLSRVAAECADEGTGLVEELCANDIPLPVVASVLEERCGSRLEFVELVRRALYREFRFFPGGITESNRQELVDDVREKNPTLGAVASLCATRASHWKGWAPNPRVRAVVTFNLDRVLQAYVRARYGKPLLRTIDRASAQAISERTNIYHMHGFLRFDAKAGNLAKEAPDAMVLTEQDYFNFFNNPTSLFNYTFLYLLRETPCLFVGLSMKDENMRRLLHFSKQERLLGLESEGRKAEEHPHELVRHFAILKQHGTSQLDLAVEDSLRALGTEVLWIEEYDEIEPRLRDVSRAAAGR